MRVILVIFLASSIFARPQSGQQPDPSSGRGFQSSDKDTEVLGIEVLETHDVSFKKIKIIITSILDSNIISFIFHRIMKSEKFLQPNGLAPKRIILIL